MTRGLGGPRVKARLAREGSRRGVLRAGRKQNVAEHDGFRPEREKSSGLVTVALTSRPAGLTSPTMARRNADRPWRVSGPTGSDPILASSWQHHDGNTIMATPANVPASPQHHPSITRGSSGHHLGIIWASAIGGAGADRGPAIWRSSALAHGVDPTRHPLHCARMPYILRQPANPCAGVPLSRQDCRGRRSDVSTVINQSKLCAPCL